MLVNKNFRVGKNRGEKPIKIGLLNKIKPLFTCFWLLFRSIFGHEKLCKAILFRNAGGKDGGGGTQGSVA
jgi:hypothetical protein